MNVAPLESPLHVCQESNHHALKLSAVQTYATGCVITAAKYSNGVYGSGSVYHAGTALDYINGWVRFLDGETTVWLPILEEYIETDYPIPHVFGLVVNGKVLHGHYVAPNGSPWIESDSTSIDFSAAEVWPDIVTLDAEAIAAIQALVPALTGTLSLSGYHPSYYGIHAELKPAGSIELRHGHTLIVAWGGNYAVFKRHESSLVPTGVFHWDYGAELVDEITIS